MQLFGIQAGGVEGRHSSFVIRNSSFVILKESWSRYLRREQLAGGRRAIAGMSDNMGEQKIEMFE
jgi:hypothetical protein